MVNLHTACVALQQWCTISTYLQGLMLGPLMGIFCTVFRVAHSAKLHALMAVVSVLLACTAWVAAPAVLAVLAPGLEAGSITQQLAVLQFRSMVPVILVAGELWCTASQPSHAA